MESIPVLTLLQEMCNPHTVTGGLRVVRSATDSASLALASLNSRLQNHIWEIPFFGQSTRHDAHYLYAAHMHCKIALHMAVQGSGPYGIAASADQI